MTKKTNYTFLALTICAFLLIWGKPLLSPYSDVNIDHRITFDTFGYYLYLPAIIIHQDPGIEDRRWVDELFEKYSPSNSFYQVYGKQEGRGCIKYSMGMAFLYLPFFLIAHLIALLSSYPADGMSYPYEVALSLGSYIYAFIGLLFAGKVLNKFFSDGSTALSLLLLFLATNYLQIASNQTQTAHPYLFSLYAIIIWYIIKWHEQNFAFKTGLTLTFFFGLAILARPSAFVLILIIIFYNASSRQALKQKWLFLLSHKLQFLKYFLLLLLIASPQLIYWNYVTGSFITFSYPSDGFDFNSPFFKEILFSYRKGWLVYTPFMFIPIFGLIIIYKRYKSLAWAIPLFFIVNLYLLASWNAWWFGGSFGNRGFVESYAVMLIPLAATIDYIKSRNWVLKGLFTFLIIGFCSLNLFQTWQMNHGLLDQTYMTKNYYWAVFGKTNTNANYRKQLAVDRGAVFNNREEYNSVLQEDLTDFFMKDTSFHSTPRTSSHPFDVVLYNLSHEEHLWVVADVTIESEKPLKIWDFCLTLEVNHKKPIKHKSYWITEGENNLYHVHAEFLTPLKKSEKKDYFRTYFRNNNGKKVKINSYVIEFFEPTYYWDYERRK